MKKSPQFPVGAAQPGAAIRQMRIKLGLTLQEVSKRTGLAASTISKLEMGKASLSYEKLSLVSTGLGIKLPELLGLLGEGQADQSVPLNVPGRRIVQRLGEGLKVQTGAYLHNFLAVELLHKQLIPVVGELRARTIGEFVAEFGDLIRHPGEEFVYVLEGEIEFHTELYAPVRLKQGESVYFDSGMGHAYLAASEGICRVLSVSTGAGTDMLRQYQKSEGSDKALARTAKQR